MHAFAKIRTWAVESLFRVFFCLFFFYKYIVGFVDLFRKFISFLKLDKGINGDACRHHTSWRATKIDILYLSIFTRALLTTATHLRNKIQFWKDLQLLYASILNEVLVIHKKYANVKCCSSDPHAIYFLFLHSYAHCQHHEEMSHYNW